MNPAIHARLFAKRLEETEDNILGLAGEVGQSHKRPAETGWIERRITEIFGCSYIGPILPLSLPLLLWDDFQQGIRTGQLKEQTGTETENIIEAVTYRLNGAWTLARTMVVAYWDILELYGVKIGNPWRFFRETAMKIFSYGLLNNGEAYCKYQTAYLLARCLSNEPPERPSWLMWWEKDGYITTGPAMRTLWCRLVLRRRKMDISLAYSLYQAKKVAPECAPNLVSEALDKNLRLLTDERPEDIPGVDDLEYEVRRTVRELCRNTGPSCGIVNEPFPSLSGCYENTKFKGGALEWLMPMDDFRVLNFKNLLGYVEYRTRVRPVYGHPYESDSINLRSYDEPDPELLVRRHGIVEPFKVRVISMGSARQYQALKSFQNLLWGVLKKSSIFDLTHRPCEVGDVASIGRWLETFAPHHYCLMVSGDYQSATDNLHPQLSEACVEEICEFFNIPWRYRPLILAGLTRHTIVEYDEVLRQTWGQLMGSPISFPILCIINCAVTRQRMEKAFGTYIPLVSSAGGLAPMKVNGDDILFPLPPGEYQEWCHDVTRAGLSPSVGKNYVSRRIAVINSEIYDLDPDWDRGRCEVSKIPYVNLGLLRYVQEHGRGDDCQAFLKDNHVSTLRERLLSATEGWKPEFADKLISYALNQNSQILSRIPPVSWWVAEEYGGLGLPSFREVHIPEHHLKLAAAFTMVDQRLIWSLKHPRSVSQLTTFSQETEFYIEQIYKELGIPYEYLNPSMEEYLQPGQIFVPQILKGNTLWGSGTEYTGVGFLKRWAYVFNRWMKILRKNWLVFKPMNPSKAVIPTGKMWIRCMRKDNTCPPKHPVLLQEIADQDPLMGINWGPYIPS